MTKRIFGYLFIVLAILLTLAIIGQLQGLLGALFGFFKIFTGTVDENGVGYALGMITYWIIHFFLTITLWNYGRKWIKTNSKNAQ